MLSRCSTNRSIENTSALKIKDVVIQNQMEVSVVTGLYMKETERVTAQKIFFFSSMPALMSNLSFVGSRISVSYFFKKKANAFSFWLEFKYSLSVLSKSIQLIAVYLFRLCFSARGDANIPGLHPCPHESDETDINDAAYETAINLWRH